MASTAGERPAEWVGVSLIAGHFAAIHYHRGRTTFVSEHPESDLRVASAAAATFAQTHHIPLLVNVQEMHKRVFTVIEKDGRWYPAHFNSDQLQCITKIGEIDLGGTQENAVALASGLAQVEESDFFPEFGISLSHSARKKH